ncbi:type III polyketide synthase [Planctopirus hydrillae]|uniref:Stilbene synthase n=1 Tax=Planctopirus hydrillae TaxID=1841610 RepID=A0A1C3EAX9_9PLAN|nr:type III polyketide synthase [Planctopirus hydrillae]ODA30395.1 stilbene synthase [Planctopirus hydrillae]
MAMLISGIGTAAPASRIPQMDAYSAMSNTCCDSDEHRRVMEMIYQGSGVKHRGSVLVGAEPDDFIRADDRDEFFFYERENEEDHGPSTQERMRQYEQHALPLAIKSSVAALRDAGQDAREITHIVTVSCSGFNSPGVDMGLIEELGLNRNTSRTHVGFMGCHGSFNGLRVAHGYTAADPDAVVLMCSVELCSLHHHYGWTTDKVIANALFADGSGAVICRSSKIEDRKPAYQLIRSGSFLVPNTKFAMSWRIGNHGFEMTLSQKVPALIEEHLVGWLTPFLAREGLTIKDIAGWAIHPGGPRILDSCLAALSLSNSHVAPAREVLEKHGNMSSSTILFVLDRMREEKINGPVVALGFGPGLAIEAMLLKAENV